MERDQQLAAVTARLKRLEERTVALLRKSGSPQRPLRADLGRCRYEVSEAKRRDPKAAKEAIRAARDDVRKLRREVDSDVAVRTGRLDLANATRENQR